MFAHVFVRDVFQIVPRRARRMDHQSLNLVLNNLLLPAAKHMKSNMIKCVRVAVGSKFACCVIYLRELLCITSAHLQPTHSMTVQLLRAIAQTLQSHNYCVQSHNYCVQSHNYCNYCVFQFAFYAGKMQKSAMQ